MKNGRCPKCGSTNVYIQTNGIMWENQAGVYVKGMGLIAKPHPVDTYVCVDCGYFEHYLTEREFLPKIAASNKWSKVQ